MTSTLETYQRVCTRKEDHDGEHLPFYKASKDEFGNAVIQHPRCVHVDDVPEEEEQVRYRIIFEMVDPRMPKAGWHEVGRETDDLDELKDQYHSIVSMFGQGEDVRFPRIERAVIKWEKVEM